MTSPTYQDTLRDQAAIAVYAALLHPGVTGQVLEELYGTNNLSMAAWAAAERLLARRPTPVPAAPNRKFTVVLRAPDYLDLDEPNLTVQVEADDPKQALAQARFEATAAQADGDEIENTTDFALLHVFAGWIEDLAPQAE
jgi:hypothetical protein